MPVAPRDWHRELDVRRAVLRIPEQRGVGAALSARELPVRTLCGAAKGAEPLVAVPRRPRAL